MTWPPGVAFIPPPAVVLHTWTVGSRVSMEGPNESQRVKVDGQQIYTNYVIYTFMYMYIYICIYIPVNTNGWFFRPLGEIQIYLIKGRILVFKIVFGKLLKQTHFQAANWK